MKHGLQNLTDFQKVLNNYRISEASQKVLKATRLVLLTAPTSSGRNTLIRELVKTDEYHYIVSDTTRQPRINDGVLEQSGVEYWFRDEAEVLEDLKQGNFLEAALIHNQQVSGISIRELKKAHQAQKIAVTDVEIIGAHNIVEAKPDTVIVFVVPPSFEEWQHRLHHRGHMSRAELRRRMESAVEEFSAALERPYYKFVINDTVAHATEEIHELAVLGKTDPVYQSRARNLVEQLYIETIEFIKTI